MQVVSIAGSSPLTRGKLPVPIDTVISGGLIPAHAGKTKSVDDPRSRMWAHPRSRGENSLTALIVIVPPGSSPLTRGKLTVDEEAVGVGGLIPAHAGKTSRTCARFPSPWAHPRSRGENICSFSARMSSTGSSPLTRGKRAGMECAGHVLRLIPAHAGKTYTP